MTAHLLSLSFTGTDEEKVREGRALPWERPQARPQALPLPRVAFLSGKGSREESCTSQGQDKSPERN